MRYDSVYLKEAIATFCWVSRVTNRYNVLYHILKYCFFGNLTYNVFRNKYDKPAQQKMKGEGLQKIGWEKFCSAQLVVAALNEEQGIGPTLTEFIENLHISHILVVDGHSVDRTVEIAKNLGANIAFQDGTGKGNAVAKALQHLDSNVKYVILTDADYTYPAGHVPEMIAILEKNPQVGMVCGNRFSGEVELKSVRSSFYFGNKLLAFAHNLFNGVSLNDPLTGLRVIRTEILRDWNVKSQGFDIEVELNSLVERKGYKTVEIPIKYRPRIGEKKLKAKHGATILKRILQETTQ
jgi:glycosyltransferase involved in cell wall biosynthesis